jgi:HD-GYP domain-containing protein (c-di-GMP phosphodiesterase class II)
MTAGHAEKVTEYALGICRELGMSKDYFEVIRVASLFHDYGKIGIPDAILKKEGRLTDDEYRQVQAHVDKTREILEQITLKGIYGMFPNRGQPSREDRRHRLPKGLKGSEIPFGFQDNRRRRLL